MNDGHKYVELTRMMFPRNLMHLIHPSSDFFLVGWRLLRCIPISIGIPLAMTIILLGFSSCKTDIIPGEEPPLPFNPFDTVDYTPGDNPNVLIDSSSFLGIHNYIMSTTCAVPACHDGSFEPDYRTVQSAYNTLVYHPVVKNNATNDFTYRVMPGDTGLSWLHERLTTDDIILGQMPLYDTPLTAQQLGHIEEWILDGAPDVFGNNPVLPNFQPQTYGFVCYNGDTTGAKLDTMRPTAIEPMRVPPGVTNLHFWFGLYDDVDLPFMLTYNKVKLSEYPTNFSGAQEFTLNPVITPFWAFSAFGGPLPYFHYCDIPTAGLTVGKIYYIRVYVKDSSHTLPTEIPEDGSQLYLYTYFAFVLQ